MGLLTGFSIISAAEILYFAAKIGWNITQKNMSKNKNKNFNPNSEGVPATHLSEGGGHIVPPPGKYSINGPN